MFFHRRFFVSILVAVLCVAGCQGKEHQSPPGQGSKVLARVNGTPIMADDVNFRLEKAHGGTDSRSKSLDDIINQELLYQQGVKLGLDKDPSYKAKLADLERQPSGARRLEMARRVFNTQIAAKVNLMPRDGQEYYDRNADRIATELHLELIKSDSRQEAEEALRKIRGGAAFESVARPIMEGREQWDLGFVKWEQIPVEFVEPVYKLKPAEVSDILGSQQTGFQIIKVVERRKIGKTAYSAIQGTVMNRLRDLKLLEAYNQYMDQLRKDAKIEKF
jgi:peptidyl-prolyl cis-trans isomerase C